MELLEKLIEDNLNKLRDKGINELVISRVGSILDLLLIDNVGDYRYRLDHNLATATDEEGGALVVGAGIKYKTYLQVKPDYYAFYLLDRDDNVVMEGGRLTDDVKRIATYFYGYESNDPVYYDRTEIVDLIEGLMVFCKLNGFDLHFLTTFTNLMRLVDDFVPFNFSFFVSVNFSLSVDDNLLITFKYKNIKIKFEFLDDKSSLKITDGTGFDSGIIFNINDKNDLNLIEKIMKEKFVKEVSMLKLEELSV